MRAVQKALTRSAVLILSPYIPDDRSGAGLAAGSTIRICQQQFAHAHFVAFSPDPVQSSVAAGFGDNVSWHHVRTPKPPTWIRFGRSLPTRKPATAVAYHSKPVLQQLSRIFQTLVEGDTPVAVIFEDIPLASLLPFVRRQLPSASIAVRSQNVAAHIFRGFCKSGSHLMRQLWCLETRRLRKLEHNILRDADCVWAISSADFNAYKTEYSLFTDGIFSIALDSRKFASVESGAMQTVLYLGSADLRKARGIANFIEHAWEPIQQAVPSALFLLAGRDTNTFTNDLQRIHGYGFYKNELEFLGKGLIFVNPQEVGSGVKIKSIVAMLAGKALVATREGVKGIPGMPGEHFLVADNAAGLAPLVIELMQNPQRARRLAAKGQQLAVDFYSEAALAESTRPLLTQFLNSQTLNH